MFPVLKFNTDPLFILFLDVIVADAYIVTTVLVENAKIEDPTSKSTAKCLFCQVYSSRQIFVAYQGTDLVNISCKLQKENVVATCITQQRHGWLNLNLLFTNLFSSHVGVRHEAAPDWTSPYKLC